MEKFLVLFFAYLKKNEKIKDKGKDKIFSGIFVINREKVEKIQLLLKIIFAFD